MPPRISAGSACVCLALLLPATFVRAQDAVEPVDPAAVEATDKEEPKDTAESAEGTAPATTEPLPALDESPALPPLIEPLPGSAEGAAGEVPPLEGTMAIPATGELMPLEPDSLPPPEETPAPIEAEEDLSSTFEGDGFGGLPGAPSGFVGGGGNFGFPGAGPYGNPGAGPYGSLGSGMRNRTLLRGFHASASLSGTYSTNVAPNGVGGSDSGNDDSSGGDFSMSLGGALSYMSTAPRFTFGGSYYGSYNQYFNESDLSGYSQGASFMANYKAGKLYLSLNVGLSYDEGSNRYYDSEYVGVLNISTGLNVRYSHSPKTTITGNLGTSFSATDDGSFDNSGSFNSNVSALYRYSPKTEFGPGVQFGYQSADGENNARTSVGPTFTMNYKLSRLISMNSMLGLEFSSYEDGGSADPSINGSLGLNYTPGGVWGMNLSIFKGTSPDPSNSGGYTDTTSVSIGYNRSIRRASWNVGASYIFDNSADAGGSSSVDDENQNSWSLNTSLGMSVFKNTCQASVFASYSDQTGGGSGESFASTSVGFSISRGF